MNEAPRKVLVTGAGGFIGRHLVRDQLERGHSVTAVDVDLNALETMDLRGDLVAAPLDIRATESMRDLVRGCDTVFHLAAAHLDVLRDESWFYEVNVRATAALVRLSAEEDAGRFVHCSSVGVYGPLQSLPADEQTPPAPDIAYERSKLVGEDAVREAASGSRMATVIIRPAWVFGPACPRTLKLIRTIARKRFFLMGDGRNLRHPIYITDMLAAFELAATKTLPSGEVIIVAGPETVTVRRLVDLIIEELGIDYEPPRLPAWAMTPVCLIIEKLAAFIGKEPPFSRRSLKFFSDNSAFAIAKAERLLDFHPRFETREGLRRTIRYYRREGLL